MKLYLKPVAISLFLSLAAVPASASYIAATWDDNGSISNHEWSDADGYTFIVEEFSDNLRIDAENDGRKLRITALDGILSPGVTGAGVYDIITFDGDDPALIDHSTFNTEGPGDHFTIVSIGGWDGSTFDSLVFNFQITENNDLVTGSGCIGIACGNTAVPVPAAVWLFGSALAGLGWMRRKPTV